jgi:hypothetical protein
VLRVRESTGKLVLKIIIFLLATGRDETVLSPPSEIYN